LFEIYEEIFLKENTVKSNFSKIFDDTLLIYCIPFRPRIRNFLIKSQLNNLEKVKDVAILYFVSDPCI
jgi:hypothetical protein